MDLTLSGELANQILVMTKKDNKLALALANQFLSTIEPAALAGFLLTRNVALDLLAARIRNKPEETLRDLQRLPVSDGSPRRGKVAIARGAAARSAGPAGKASRRKRQRLTANRVDQIKEAVKSYLAHHPWSTRKHISSEVPFPSLGIYNRIMAELRQGGEIVARGEKAKTVYAVKGSRGKAGAKTAGARKRTKDKTKTKTKTKTKAKKQVKASSKTKAKKREAAPRPPLLCPFPGCQNKGAPVFGMMCREHKDLPKEERLRLFAERRQGQQGDG